MGFLCLYLFVIFYLSITIGVIKITKVPCYHLQKDAESMKEENVNLQIKLIE